MSPIEPIEPIEFEGLKAVRLRTTDGATAIATSYGAHVVSWVPAGGHECIYVSERSPYVEGQPIRGGVPVVFPQFATYGSLPHHGFARTQMWHVVPRPLDEGVVGITFRLESSRESRDMWPHWFSVELTVRIAGARLEIDLRVRNQDDEAFAFNAALHTYLRIGNLQWMRIDGLSGLRYLDRARSDAPATQTQSSLAVTGEIDRVYLDVADTIRVTEPGRAFAIGQRGFTDTVIWNPGKQKTARLTDMPADGYLRMLCVEAAAVRTPISLAPSGEWTGTQSLLASFT